MESLKITKRQFVEDLIDKVNNGEAFHSYLDMDFAIKEKDLINTNLDLTDLTFQLPNEKSNFEYENAVILYKKLKNFDRTKASDIRFWTTISHYYLKDYMIARWNIKKYFEKIEEAETDLTKKNDQKIDYIFEHYLIKTVSTQSLIRSGISGLWWGAYLTVDEARGPGKEFDLTKEYFSMLDYGRSLMGGQIGRCSQIVHGVLEFVLDNPELFSKNKEAKIRWIVRGYLNRMGGVKPVSALSKENIIEKLSIVKDKIQTINS